MKFFYPSEILSILGVQGPLHLDAIIPGGVGGWIPHSQGIRACEALRVDRSRLKVIADWEVSHSAGLVGWWKKHQWNTGVRLLKWSQSSVVSWFRGDFGPSVWNIRIPVAHEKHLLHLLRVAEWHRTTWFENAWCPLAKIDGLTNLKQFLNFFVIPPNKKEASSPFLSHPNYFTFRHLFLTWCFVYFSPPDPAPKMPRR